MRSAPRPLNSRRSRWGRSMWLPESPESAQKNVGANEEEEEKKYNQRRDGRTEEHAIHVTFSRLQSPPPVAPLRVIDPRDAPQATPLSMASTQATPLSAPTSTPMGSVGGRVASLNNTAYADRIALMLFIFHLLVVLAAMGFFGFRATKSALSDGKDIVLIRYWVPQVGTAAFLGLVFSLLWQKTIRAWPEEMVKIILWSGFFINSVTGLMLICFSVPSSTGLGALLMFFSVCQGLYACWVTPRIDYAKRILKKAIEPTSKFPQLTHPCYWLLSLASVWTSVWGLTVVGALNFYFPPLTIFGLVLSLAWTVEIFRNVIVITVSRVLALFYLRGMQASVKFSIHRALTVSLGTACLGSIFVPCIDALRMVARVLNLLEGEDEFMFSCAHCCYRVMEAIFRYGNNWAFVYAAAYGKGFVSSSRSCYELFERNGMEPLLDSDITSSICFLSGVSTGSLCVLICGAWTFKTQKEFTATVSLIAFFIGYIMTRISLSLPQACVSAYYVCYAENPKSKSFDQTIPQRMEFIANGGDKSAIQP